MSENGKQYIAARVAEEQAATERRARVKEFIAENDAGVISDLFTVIKDTIIESGVRKSAAIMEQHKLATAAVFEVECEMMELL